MEPAPPSRTRFSLGFCYLVVHTDLDYFIVCWRCLVMRRWLDNFFGTIIVISIYDEVNLKTLLGFQNI